MFGVLLAKKQRQVTSDKVADAGNKMLESEEDEEADDNEDEENQVSSGTALFRGAAAAAVAAATGDLAGGGRGNENDTTGQQCANISYRKLVTVSPPLAAGQFSCSIFDDKTGNFGLDTLKSRDFIGDIQKSSDSTGDRTNGRRATESETKQEFGTNFKGKLDGNDFRQLANKTSENAQLKRFKLDSASLQQQQQQQQNDQMRQSFQPSSFERLSELAVAGGERDNLSVDAKQQRAHRMTAAAVPTTTIEAAASSPKQNGTTTNEVASNNSDYLVNQNGARIRLEESPSYAPAATSLAELSQATISIVANEAGCEDDADDDDDGDDDGAGGGGNREDEQTSAQVAATLKDGNRHLNEYGSVATGIPDGRYGDSAGCRSPASALATTMSPSNVTTALFDGQGQLTELPARHRLQQQQQESQSAVGTNQVLVAGEAMLACTKRVIQVEGDGLHFGPGFDALRRQPLRRTWQQQKQQLEPTSTAAAPLPLPPPPPGTNNPQQPPRSRLLSIAQHHHDRHHQHHTSGSGDGEQKRVSPLSASRGRPAGLQEQSHAPGGDGNDRSCASYRNENYENHIHLEQAFGGSNAGSASSLGDNKEKWYEQSTPSDVTARSAAFVNKREARDGELYRLAMIDQGEKKETMTENLKQYPPNHPLGNSKHLCAICGDRATGKHYGVFSCEGCKGFFKRTIRKDIVYVCRAQSDCLIDMRQRNRCQYCRYQKCLSCGMKREAVQEEKQRLKLRAAASANQQQQQQSQHQQLLPSDMNGSHVFNQCDTSEIKLDSTNHYNHYNLDHHLGSSPTNYTTGNSSSLVGSHYDRFGAAYHSSGHSLTDIGSFRSGPMRIDELTLKWAAQVQIECLLDWAKSVPRFTGLLIDDQVTLMKAYWNELIIAHIAFKTAEALRDGTLASGGSDKLNSLCIGRGLFIDAYQAYEIGLGTMFDRIIDELVIKMRDMRLDVNELACLRAIILFNPETHGLKTSQPIEEYRGDIYTTLESYCRRNYENQPNRFGKLLLRLPALRSIGLKCDPMRQQRRCDSNANQIVVSHQGFVTRSSPASRGSSSPTNSSVSSISSTSTTTATATTTGTNPNYKYGYQVNLLFFGLCYEMSSIDSFLRSSFSLN